MRAPEAAPPPAGQHAPGPFAERSRGRDPPRRLRTRRATGWPRESKARLITRFLPSVMVRVSQVLPGFVFSRRTSAGANLPSGRSIPFSRALSSPFRRWPFHLDAVGLRNSVAGMLEPLGKLPVIGQDEESFRVVVQASDRIHPLRDAVEKIRHDGPALRIAQGRHVPLRFVQHEVDLFRLQGDESAVHPDFIPLADPPLFPARSPRPR